MFAIISIFRAVRDPRDVNARHDLTELLFLSLATLCGAKSCVEIADFVEDREEELKEIVTLAHGPPSHDTFSRVFPHPQGQRTGKPRRHPTPRPKHPSLHPLDKPLASKMRKANRNKQFFFELFAHMR